jgi:hypothetical protein
MYLLRSLYSQLELVSEEDLFLSFKLAEKLNVFHRSLTIFQSFCQLQHCRLPALRLFAKQFSRSNPSLAIELIGSILSIAIRSTENTTSLVDEYSRLYIPQALMHCHVHHNLLLHPFPLSQFQDACSKLLMYHLILCHLIVAAESVSKEALGFISLVSPSSDTPTFYEYSTEAQCKEAAKKLQNLGYPHHAHSIVNSLVDNGLDVRLVKWLIELEEECDSKENTWYILYCHHIKPFHRLLIRIDRKYEPLLESYIEKTPSYNEGSRNKKQSVNCIPTTKISPSYRGRKLFSRKTVQSTRSLMKVDTTSSMNYSTQLVLQLENDENEDKELCIPNFEVMSSSDEVSTPSRTLQSLKVQYGTPLPRTAGEDELLCGMKH